MQRFTTWLQEHAREGLYDLEELSIRNGILEVRLCLLKAPNRRLLISFSSSLACRQATESDSYITLDEVKAASIPGRFFYVVEDSEYVNWLVKQGHGLQKAESLTHYTIITVDDVIDVLALDPPTVTVPEITE